MKTVINIFFALLFVTGNVYGQTDKEIVYLLFNNSSKEKCQVEVSYSSDNDGKKDGFTRIKKYKRVHEKKRSVFYICDEEFGFAHSEKLDTLRSIDGLNIQSIEYLKKKYNEGKEFKHHVFEKVFLLEKISETKILKYDVTWCCEWSID